LGSVAPAQHFRLEKRVTAKMKRGFYTIMGAQFFSSLADNALLIAAIALLRELAGPEWVIPLLKFFFTVSYVALAPFVGAFADSMAKGRVMFLTNGIKIIGCLSMLCYAFIASAGILPYMAVILAYAITGLGAAAYSPAKYGILTELLPANQLVAANGWIEGLTVTSIILGTVLGGLLVSPAVAGHLLLVDLPHFDTGIDTGPEVAIIVIAVIYVIAAIFNLYIPNTGVDHHAMKKNPFYLVHDFIHCFRLLWKDKLGQISLATTTLFWGAGATLQFIVIKWAETALAMTLDQAARLQGVVAVGIALGAVAAAKLIPLRRSVDTLPMGIVMGVIVIIMIFVSDLWVGVPLMILIGALAGFFVVPMNALLQHRGHILMGAGHSIAVQNFNENLSILIMLALYAAMIRANFSIFTVIVMFGFFVSASMVLVIWRHRSNLAKEDVLHEIGVEKLH
jgi:MFS transporter, LPLT family, lysophospholipid transporter